MVIGSEEEARMKIYSVSTKHYFDPIFSFAHDMNPDVAILSRPEVPHSLLCTARLFSDYNIREYTKLRAIDGFRHNRDLEDPSSISAAFFEGKSQLEIARRQTVVYSLKAPNGDAWVEANEQQYSPKPDWGICSY
ncbi:uncharacterized protein LOC131167265 [Malania oleifera]|uniref:uncharacterized protein LOC131167265 n=1 Tax=Malania oleifera TaxID=397392 RepID=UPI0025AE094B|nr:uncharacterized protein LOC131167265 [Malania oleifera]